MCTWFLQKKKTDMAMDLPQWVVKRPMSGSPPMERWGRSLRLEKARLLQSMGVRTIMLAIRPHIQEGELEEMGCVDKKSILTFVHQVCMYALSCNEAKYWIDRKDEKPYQWLPAAYHRCVQYNLNPEDG